MNQGLCKLLVVLLAPFSVLAVAVRAQDVPPPATSEAPAAPKAESAATSANDESTPKKIESPAAEAPVPAKDESTKESPSAKNEATPTADAAAPAQDKTAPVAETPAAPASTPTPVPAAPTPAPAAETVAAASPETPTPAQETPTPVKEVVSPVAETPVPPAAIPAPTPEPTAPAPAKQDVAPVTETTLQQPAPSPAPAPVAPAAETVAAVPQETPAPAKEAVAPVVESATPSAAIPAPAPVPEPTTPAPTPVTPAAESVAAAPQETPTPPVPPATVVAPEAVAPASVTPAPEKVAEAPQETPAPTKQEVAPVAETVAPASATSAPTPVAPAPVPATETVATAPQEAPAPAKEVIAPVAETVTPPPTATVPAAEPVAPAPEPAKPVQESVAAVATESPAPAKEAPAPAPETAAPVPSADTTSVTATATAPVPTETVSAPPAAAVVVESVKPVSETVTAVAAESAATAQEKTTPSKEVVAPVAETVTPPPAVTVPVPELVAPAPEPVKPAQENVVQTASEAPTPAKESPVPSADPTSVAAAAAPSAPVETVPAPVATAPTAEPVASATVSVATSPESTPAPTESVPAPPPAPPAAEEAKPAPETVAAAPTENPTPVATASQGLAVDHFEFTYGLEHPALPSLAELQKLTIKATRDGNVYRASAASGAASLALGSIPEGSRFDVDALREVAQEVVRWYNSRGLYGVWVAYADLESSASGLVDNRPADNRSARLVVWASQIAKVRTLARGKRIKTEASINNSKHRRIIQNSPLHPGKTPDQPGSLFNKKVLDDYLYGLSLHPGRRVEASIASAGQPGRVVLDYLVNETRAWQLFSQVNNYGTVSTGRIRARVGFQDNQLTNHDDILNLDVIGTTDFKTYGSFLSYRLPLWRPAKVLMRIYASYGDFATLGSGEVVSRTYLGKNWQGGLEFSNRLSLWRGWQLQSALGANFNHYELASKIDTSDAGSGNTNFLMPFIGVTLSHDYTWGGISGGLRLDSTVGSFANTSTTDGIELLGRKPVDSKWTSARWNLNGTVFLDALFSHPDQTPAMAHEVTAYLKGRQLFGAKTKRMIPQEQEPLGGAMSIRGYPESIISADEFISSSIEYGYHLPRALKPGDEGKLFGRPMRWRPKQTGQNPDWDLVLRAFFDYGYRKVNPDPNQTPDPAVATAYNDKSFGIAGTGIGFSLFVKQYFSFRCDLGMALTKLEDKDREEGKQIIVAKGDKQVHLSSSFTW